MKKVYLLLFIILLIGCQGSELESQQKSVKDTIYNETDIQITVFEDYKVTNVAASKLPNQDNYTEIQVAYKKNNVVKEDYTAENAVESIQSSSESGSYFTHVREDGFAIQYRPWVTSDLENDIEVNGEAVSVRSTGGLDRYTFNYNKQTYTLTVLEEVYSEEEALKVIEKVLEK